MSKTRISKAQSQARSAQIVAAVRELHEAIYDAHNHDDTTALASAYLALREHHIEATCAGREIDGWTGGIVDQADAIGAGMRLLRGYNAHRHAGLESEELE